MPWPVITGFYDPHLPQPYLKSTFFDLWRKEGELLRKTSSSKFRSCEDINQFLFRYWHLCSGNFVPAGFRNNYVEWVRDYDDSVKFHDSILSGKYKMCCINDGVLDDTVFPEIRDKLNQAFEHIFPDKSSFEI